MPIQNRPLGKWGKRGMIFSILLVVAGATYGITLYSSGAEQDRDLAYTALYYDDLSVDLFNANASYDAVVSISSVAWDFCELYNLEVRTLDKHRYAPLCQAIQNRTALLVMCPGLDCSDQILELQRLFDAAAPLAKELKENIPYYGYVLNNDPLQFKTQHGEPIKILPG